MRRLAVAAALAASSFLPSLAAAQIGSTSAVLLELPASTRALSLGNTFVAAGTDEAAIFYNPAQLAVIPKLSAGLSVQQWFLSSTLAAAAAATRVGRGTLAIGLQVLDYGSSERVLGDPNAGGGGGDPTGTTISAGDYVASAAYALSLHGVRVGATAKYVNQRLVDESGGTGAVDVGAAFDVHGATIGASVQNIGGEISIAGESGPLPRMVHVGAAVPVRGVGPLDFLATAEVTHTRDEKTRGAGGVEVAYHATGGVTVLGRVGALARPTGAEISPLSFGGGLRARHLALDYAYESSDVFGAMHRVGVRWWR
ncbi:MAG TPA: PorV/PorQ family protein [Gemmatimonadaceae bacterium]